LRREESQHFWRGTGPPAIGDSSQEKNVGDHDAGIRQPTLRPTGKGPSCRRWKNIRGGKPQTEDPDPWVDDPLSGAKPSHKQASVAKAASWDLDVKVSGRTKSWHIYILFNGDSTLITEHKRAPLSSRLYGKCTLCRVFSLHYSVGQRWSWKKKSSRGKARIRSN